MEPRRRRITKECTNRQAVYLTSLSTHTYKHKRSHTQRWSSLTNKHTLTHTYTQRQRHNEGTRSFRSLTKTAVSWMKPRWRRRQTIVSMCACLCECAIVIVCVRPSYLQAGTKRAHMRAHERVRERESESELITWMKLPKLSLSHQVAFQEQQLRASRTHTCHLSYSFARVRRASSHSRRTTNAERRMSFRLRPSCALSRWLSDCSDSYK